MIFKTTDDGGLTNIFKELKSVQVTFEELDKTTLRNAIKAFNNTSISVDNLSTKFGGLDDSVVGYLKSTERGQASMEGLSKSIDNSTTSMISATAKAKILAVALNALTGLAISLAIKGITWAVDELIVTLDEQKEKLDDAVNAYKESETELANINDELKTTSARIDELNGKDNLTFTEQDELEKLIKTNDELERKIYLLEQANKEAEKEVVTEAQNTYDKYTNNRTLGAVEQIEFYADSSLLEGVNWDNFKDDLSWLVAQYRNQEEILKNAQVNGWTEVEEQVKSNLELLEGYMSEASLDYQDLYDKISGISDYAMTDDLKIAKKDLDDILDIVAEILGYGGQRTEDDIKGILAKVDFQGYENKLIKLGESGSLSVDRLKKSFPDLIKYLNEAGISAEELYQYIMAIANPNALNYDELRRQLMESSGIRDGQVNGASDAKIYGVLQSSGVLSNEGLEAYLTVKSKFTDGETEFWSVDDWIYHIQNELKQVENPDETDILSTITSSIQQIATQLEPQFSELGDAYKAIFTDDGFTLDSVDNSMLEGLRKSFAEIEDEVGVAFDSSQLEQFFNTLTDGSSKSQDVQKVFNDLATSYFYCTDTMEQLNEENAKSIEKQLTEMGVTNANAVVTDALAKKKEQEALAIEYSTRATAYNSQEKNKNAQVSTDLSNATSEEILQIIEEGNVSSETAQSLAAYASEKIYSGSLTLSTAGDCENLAKLCDSLGIAAGALKNYAYAKKVLESAQTWDDSNPLKQITIDNQLKILEGLEDKANDIAKNAVDSLNTPLEVKFPSTSSSSSGSGSGSSSSTEETSQTYNWIETLISRIERKITNLGKTVSATYKKWSTRNNTIAQELGEITKEIGVQQAAYERYMQQANSVGLSQEYIDKIQNGTLDIETITDESLSNMIDEYQDWYDKAIECSDAIENLKNELAELAKQKFDNINTYFNSLIETTNKSIDKLEIQRDNSYKVYNPNVYKGLYSETQQLIDYNTKKVQQLEDALDSAVNNGYIEAGSESWREMYNEILDVRNAVEEYRIELNEIAQSEYEALLKPIEESLSRLESRKNVIDTMIDRLELQGYVASKGLYERQLRDSQERLETLKQEGQQLQQSLQDALSKGLEVGSDAWVDMQSAVDDNTVSVMELENNMIELNNAIRDLDWSKFDRLQDTISRITEESDFMIDLFDKDNLYDDNGKLTTEGEGVIGLHTQNYYIYSEQAKKYKDEIDKINNELVSDSTNTTLIDKKNELIDAYQNATKAAYDEYQAIVELGQDGYKSQIDSIKELIDAKKKQLEADKVLYEYQKNITEKTKNVADIQKQLAALANDDSEENKAKIQQLKVDLEDAQKELQDTQYDKWYNDQAEMLDNLYEEYESLMTEQSQNDHDIFTDMIEYANANAENIQNVINQKADDWNYTMSSISDTIWKPGFNGLTDIGINIYEEIQRLCEINEKMYRVSSDLGDLGVTQYGLETTISDENTARGFIEQLYQGLLGRSADDSGMNYWLSKLTNGETVQDIIKGFLESPEYVALNKSVNDIIYDLYKSVLGRTPELSGYQYWMNQYQNGMSLSQIATHGFLDSDEFLSLDNWLRLLKKGSFSTGGVIGRTGEDGIVLAKVGEGILSNDNMKLLQKSIVDSNILAQNMVKLQNMDVYRNMNRVTEQSTGHIQIINEIAIDHVDDYNDICNKFKSDPKFSNMMQEMVLGGIVGKNGLSKNKYKW